jgi:hypothetical protein
MYNDARVYLPGWRAALRAATPRRSRLQNTHLLLQLVQLSRRGSHQLLSLQVQLQHLRLFAGTCHVMQQTPFLPPKMRAASMCCGSDMRTELHVRSRHHFSVTSSGHMAGSHAPARRGWQPRQRQIAPAGSDARPPARYVSDKVGCWNVMLHHLRQPNVTTSTEGRLHQAAAQRSAVQHDLRHLCTWWMMESRSTGATITMLSAMAAPGASALAGWCMLQFDTARRGPAGFSGAWPDTSHRNGSGRQDSCSSRSLCRDRHTAGYYSAAARVGRNATCEITDL